MIRCAVILAAACVMTAACSDNDTTGPSSEPLTFAAQLFPANEVPPVSGSESSGHGAVQVTFSGSSATFYFQLTGFPATTIIGAHIHPAQAGVNGPVILSTGLTNAVTLVMPDGQLEYTVTVPVDAALVQAIAANPAGYYFNVHSPSNPGGFSRGQLVRVR